MLRYIYGEDLSRFPLLRDTMFQDRATQFRDRLGWEVTVDDAGEERDSYDAMNPIYAIWERPDGRHGGSMRFLPTVADTMVNDHFRHLAGAEIRTPLIWECTRFCLAPDAEPRVSSALMLAALEVGLNFHLTDLVGVFDARMVRVYRRLGWEPTVLGSEGSGRAAISVGLWACTHDVLPVLLDRAGISAAFSQAWFDQSFGLKPMPLAATG
ncbi:acyl-homoserine-lactone synthase [Psychromarinibacter halotolerans]|uniref:Acyl-homoserine-lactone synthase n=1 Tax=Psychromarinibacter halotolerans TaxID=1775175 RepID=A0ABV7GZV4_9RHOB|nr:acyl-homoserine-lactone synthase [Psychromarinibacter halotolerans]MDF0596473.1 acyl-homoserine-lactone synthase [Psychromarinibacter halotolerans]